jgi:hypothetical protein
MIGGIEQNKDEGSLVAKGSIVFSHGSVRASVTKI